MYLIEFLKGGRARAGGGGYERVNLWRTWEFITGCSREEVNTHHFNVTFGNHRSDKNVGIWSTNLEGELFCRCETFIVQNKGRQIYLTY